MVRPDGHQRTQLHLRVAIGIPHADGHSSMIVFHAKFYATLGAPGSPWCVGHVEDVGYAAHECHGARTRVKITDLAFEVLHIGLPGFDGRWFQGLVEFLGSEAIANR